MELHGKNLVGCRPVNSTAGHFSSRGHAGRFEEATEHHVQLAFETAENAFDDFRSVSPERRATFLDRIAEEIETLGDDLLNTASAETSLPVATRLVGERARTCSQLRMFAALIREGCWVDARIDRAIPDRKPIPKPDVRRMLKPLGPIAIFAASNFPLAFSVAGGDTASALAAGCPVIVKAHPAHPATSELAARAIASAVKSAGMPDGVFSLLHSTRNELAIAVVQDRRAKAVAFTGSLRAGRALFDAAARRPEPIPVYAEMGSINPVFVLPGALKERCQSLAQGMAASVLLGGGQFCTCPGFVVGLEDEHFQTFVRDLGAGIGNASPVTMLHERIAQSYDAGSKQLGAMENVRTICREGSSESADLNQAAAIPRLFVTNGENLRRHPELTEELFGPSTVVVRCTSGEEMLEVARNLEGQLTSTIHGTVEDLEVYGPLVSILEKKAGRLIFNGFPTGVEVCPAMHHGGPFPATTDSKATSVGTAAILRFARPVAYQNFPQAALPEELQDSNPRDIWRLVDGKLMRGAC
jgi:NADP-dependent aldehyde dehydrogenase